MEMEKSYRKPYCEFGVRCGTVPSKAAFSQDKYTRQHNRVLQELAIAICVAKGLLVQSKARKEAERQAREKKEEAERQAREKKEEADRKERLELEKMKLDGEIKLLHAKIEAGIVKNEPDGSDANSNDAGAKHPQLPTFQDGRDDLDIWLTRFERFAESNGWSKEKWSSSLGMLWEPFDKVKEALMRRYDLTEDGYRRKFRTCKPAEGESPDMFIVRIVTYLDRWIELSKTDKSYEKLKDLIVREQFMDACPGDLATSLREKKTTYT
ncbi:hypothetical protein PoB_005073800 [Plakobranchus ocellatus]|uniref:SCAN box domain-containing protein n=1 Tax=Plakobranchus ocellatus TaxID=259542 RepID=A0AAV4BX58_9GAST|nr:hypothetical protein PoB_005073800 [Plakobranchus ocellatus]